MKKYSLVVLVGLIVLLLSGCCMSHEWVEATCTEPKTCTKCGETEGETLGHTWVDATCSEAKHCSVCGEVEGETLEHTLTEANYQEGAICSVCGEVVGEPLEADLEKYDLKCNVELNKIYDQVTMCYSDNEKTTISKTIFYNYQIFDSNEEEGFPFVEGYEWRTVDVTFFYADENVILYGGDRGVCREDYYDIINHDESLVWDEEGMGTFTVNYKGLDYTECKLFDKAISSLQYSLQDESCLQGYKISYQVPKGYDGCIYGLINKQVVREEGQYIFDVDNTDTYLFRFDDLEDVKEYSGSEVNLTNDEIIKVLANFNHNIPYYMDEEVLAYFDEGEDFVLSSGEMVNIYCWALDNYREDGTITLTEELAGLAAKDYLTRTLDVPDSLYVPEIDGPVVLY